MKQIPLIVFFIAFFSSAFAQEGKTLGDLFKKKNKRTSQVNTTDLIVYNHNTDERDLMANGMEYFLSNVLPTNDTNYIKQVMTSRGYPFNKVLSDPISDDNDRGDSYSLLLLVVIQNCKINTLKFFLDNGANPNLRAVHRVPNAHTGAIMGTYYSRYALEAACYQYDTAKISLLIAYGANVAACAEKLKQIAANKTDLIFSEFIRSKTGGSYAKDALLKLIQDAFSRDKITPSLIADMVAKGADINANDGNTNNFNQNIAKSLLMWAIEMKLPLDCIREIIKQGANVNVGIPKSSFSNPHYPITFAANANNLPLVKLLVESGADINVIGTNFKGGGAATALRIATVNGFNEIAAYLFSKGAK